MKRVISICLILFLSASAGLANTVIKDVDPMAFQKLVDSGEGMVLDVRTPDEVAQGQIGEASVIDFHSEDFSRKLGLMNRELPVYVYCRSGGRSGRTAAMMQEMGFSRVYNLQGGMKAWQTEGLPVAKSSTVSMAKSGEGLSLASFNEAITQSETVLVDFHTSWCLPCRRMRPVIAQLEDDLAGEAKVLRIDADASPEVANAFDVVGVPVFVVIRDGKEVARMNGIVALDTLKSALMEEE